MNIPDIAIINSRVRFMFVKANGIGIGAHDVSARVKAKMGDKVNKIGEERDGFVDSFVISFRPSAIG